MSNFRVILIEDEPYQRLVTTEMLETLSYDVSLAEDGHKAWDLLQKTCFDLILLDLELPGMDGLELLSKLKQSDRLSRIPVVVCSATHEMEKVYKSLDLGAADFLVKPIKRAQIKQAVEQLKSLPFSQHAPSETLTKGYAWIKKIGQGAYATVYLVRSLSTGQLYALKRMDLAGLSPKERSNAETEVMLMKVLVGPSIVRMVEYFLDDTVMHIVMEYAEGGTLAEALKGMSERGETLDKAQIYSWLAQLVIALMLMHSKNILHRDLKCQNLFLTEHNLIKVGDMGIAKNLNSSRDMAESLAGTPYNMAPEIMKGEKYGQKTDIWSLGCVLYEMIMFRRPFEGPTLGVLRESIINADFGPILGNVDSNLRLLVSQMLNKDPKRRPDAWELANQPIIKDAIENFAREQRCEDVILPLFENDPRTKKGATNRNQAVEVDLLHMCSMARSAVQVTDRRLRRFGKTEAKVFVGQDLFVFLKSQARNSDEAALALAKELFEIGLICNVASNSFEFNQDSFYRFREDREDLPRNMIYLWKQGVREPHQVCSGLIQRVNLMLEVTDDCLAEVQTLSEYVEFVKALGELRQIDIRPYSNNYKLEFFLNIYQIMHFHQSVAFCGINPGWFSDPYKTFFYNIGGNCYTLKELKHGVLRGNKRPPGHLFRLFSDKDPRNVLPRNTDPRVLLVCKEPPCPPTALVDCYLNKEELLEEAALDFCSREVCVSLPIGEITLPRLFKTYKEDFGGTDLSVLTWVLKYSVTVSCSAETLVKLVRDQSVYLHYRAT